MMGIKRGAGGKRERSMSVGDAGLGLIPDTPEGPRKRVRLHSDIDLAEEAARRPLTRLFICSNCCAVIPMLRVCQTFPLCKVARWRHGYFLESPFFLSSDGCFSAL